MQDKTLRDKFLKWLLNAPDLDEKQARTMAFVYDKLDEWTTAKYGVSLYSGDVDRIMAVFTLMFKKGEFRDFKDPVLLVGRFLSFMSETNGVSAGRSNSPLGGGVENGPALIDSYLDFKNDNINEYEFRIRLLMGEVSFKMVSALTPKGRRLLQKFEREGKDLDDLTEKEHAKLAEETLHVPLIGEREGKNYVFVAIDAGNEGEYIKTPFLPVLFTVFKDPNVDGVIVVSEEYEELGPYILEADDVEQLVGVVNMMAEQNLDDDRDEHPQDEPQRVPVPEPTHSKPRKRHGSDGVPQDVDSDISKWSRLENCEPDNTQPVGISINNLRDNCAISFVRCQKGISAIRGIRLINNTYETLEGLRIRVRSNEGYFKDFEAAFPFPIQRGKISKPWSLDLVPTQKALPQGNSSANNNLFHTPITIEVIQDGKTLGKTSTKVWILPKYFCEFAFINDLPVFVLPDDPVVKELRTKTADILMQNTDSSSTEGYQSGKTRVVEMCKAAYEAVQSLELGYSNPPANANDLDGQRLRVPSEVKASHAGTCMDMTLLYAALVEQMGLYPILILVEGHIFCGVWLDAREHDKFLLDEKRRLKFLINKPELQSYFDCRRVIFVECTTMCRDNKSVGFEKSIDIARKDRFRNMPFNLAIDVQNARQLGVAALPDQADGDGAITIVRNTGVNASKGAAPVVRPPKTATALDRWEKELLDLDPERNLLLDLVNRGDDTPAIPFFTAHIGELEDRLPDKQPFDVVALPINDIYCKKGIKECLNIGNKLLHNFYQGCGPEDELDVFSRFPFEAAEIEDGEKLDGIELELFLKDQTCQQHRLYPLQPLERNSLIRLWMGIKSVCGQVLAMEKGDPALIE